MSIQVDRAQSVGASATMTRPAMDSAIDRLETFVFRVPLATPRINSFGKMTHRTALVVRLIDRDGVEGWGECFCNWPAFAAEHRYRILTELVAPAVAGHHFASPPDVLSYLTSRFRILSIQANEPGPFEQAIAAVDIAAWDLASRRADLPLYRILGGGEPVGSLPYYASGLSPEQAVQISVREMALGTKAFKVKVGWGKRADTATLAAVREVIGASSALMVDANQKWDMQAARAAILSFLPFDLDWVEEPIAADHPSTDFASLAGLGLPVAAGENVRGVAAFDDMMTTGQISVVQPDIIKWGGITGCWAIAHAALKAGRRYCPHYLGGGIGLIATAHLLAATGGDGLLELDATHNSLRTLLADPFPAVRDGQFELPKGPGLGVAPDLQQLAAFRQAL